MPITEPSGVAIDGTELRRIRKLAGMNLADLARHVEVTYGYISHIERGARPTISPRLFGRLCDALGVENRQQLMRAVGRSVGGVV